MADFVDVISLSASKRESSKQFWFSAFAVPHVEIVRSSHDSFSYSADCSFPAGELGWPCEVRFSLADQVSGDVEIEYRIIADGIRSIIPQH